MPKHICSAVPTIRETESVAADDGEESTEFSTETVHRPRRGCKGYRNLAPAMRSMKKGKWSPPH